jgi:hypothetical protein
LCRQTWLHGTQANAFNRCCKHRLHCTGVMEYQENAGCFKKSLLVSCIWTCSNSSSFHSLMKMIKKKRRIRFQQDGAPPHQVREYLNTRFPGRWISRVAPKAWPPRSPDYFLWGFVKDRVFVRPLPANVVELGTRITAAVAKVTPETLLSVWQEIDYRPHYQWKSH